MTLGMYKPKGARTIQSNNPMYVDVKRAKRENIADTRIANYVC